MARTRIERMILVTGGSGFIGRHLAKELSHSGEDMAVVTRTSNPRMNSERIEVIEIDLSKSDELRELPRDVDTIFHLAACTVQSNDASALRNCVLGNITVTRNLLEFARKVGAKRFINSSTVSVYGTPPEYVPIDERHPTSPTTPYGRTKLASERLCTAYEREFGMSTITLRYSSVYGKGQDRNSVLPIFIDAVIRNRPPVIFGRGECSQDFVYIMDVVRANILAQRSGVTGVLNIASGQETTIYELAKTVIELFEKEMKPLVQPSRPERGYRQVFDILKAKRELGFRPEYDVRRGLKDYKMALDKEGFN